MNPSLAGSSLEELEFPLWAENAPGALGSSPADIPTLKPYLPDPAKATGAAIVVCPGGGYECLADHEGEGYARWLNQNGVAAFVLKYRLGSNGYRHPAMLHDVARALRTVRARAAQWQVDPRRIGVIGSSAGGHLASTLLTHFDAGNPEAADPVERASSRPDLGILCYPVISLGVGTHVGTRENLLGKTPSPERVEELSNEKQVASDTPPCCVWHTGEDAAVGIEHSLDFARALRAKGVPFDLHIYQKGSHGIGIGDPNCPHPWTADCLYWLREQRFVK